MKIKLSLNDKNELMMNTISEQLDTDQTWLLAHDVDQSKEYGRMTSIVSNALYSYHHALVENANLFGKNCDLIVECKL